MQPRFSFSGIENELVHWFRNRLNQSESDADVRKCFFQLCRRYFREVFAGQIELEFNDISLVDKAPWYDIRSSISRSSAYEEATGNSDFLDILERFARQAAHHLCHQKKNPAKSESNFNRKPGNGPQVR